MTLTPEELAKCRDAFERELPRLFWGVNHTFSYRDRVVYAREVAKLYENWQAAWSAAQAGRWLTIETAPRDGYYILLYRPEIRFVGYCAKAGWVISAPGLPLMDPPPTHWMPLPTPPTQPPTPLPGWDGVLVEEEDPEQLFRRVLEERIREREAVEKMTGALKTFDEAMRNGSWGPDSAKEKARALKAAHRKAIKVLTKFATANSGED